MEVTLNVYQPYTDLVEESVPLTVEHNSKTYKVVGIGKSAYSGAAKLKSITIPENITYIGEGAFFQCEQLTEISLPQSVVSIGSGSFSGCIQLTSISLPSGIVKIENFMFEGCEQLTEISLPPGILSIGYGAFYGCSNLKEIVIPESVQTVGERAFHGCVNLPSISFPKGLQYTNFDFISDYDGTVSLYAGSFGYNMKQNLPKNKLCVIIPDDVTDVPQNAFDGVTNLISVTIPRGVTSIGAGAFIRCPNLLQLNVSESVQKIGAYNDLSNIKKIIWLPNTKPEGYEPGVINYVSNASYGEESDQLHITKSLSSMFEVDGVRYVPNPSTRSCVAIDCNYASPVRDLSIGAQVTYKSIPLTVSGIMPYACYNRKQLKKVSLDAEAAVGAYAFAGCANMDSMLVTRPTRMGDYALQNCSSLTEFALPDCVAGLGDGVWQNCSAMKSIHLGTGIPSLPAYSFSGCSSLAAISIPANVGSAGDKSFDGCTSLANVSIADRETSLSLGTGNGKPLFGDCPLDSVYIGGDLTYDKTSAKYYSPFYRNTSLRSVRFNDRETEISENEFYGCTNLQRVEIGDGVTSIAERAFSGCQSLQSFTFGSSLQSIGEEAFSDCTAMTVLTSHAATPPTCGTQALDDINKWECTLYVPEESKAAYMAADQWKEFFFVETTGIEGIGADNPASAGEKRYYDLRGLRVPYPQPGGVYIERSGRTARKVVVK